MLLKAVRVLECDAQGKSPEKTSQPIWDDFFQTIHTVYSSLLVFFTVLVRNADTFIY